MMLPKPNNPPQFLSFSKEITLALFVKFLLLAGLWMLFFSGNKQPVDGANIADKIYGVSNQLIIAPKNKEQLK